jgi:hypothetical protein
MIDQGDIPAATEHLAIALPCFAELHDLDGVAQGLELYASAHAARGDSQRATRLLGAADALRARIGIPIHPESLGRQTALTQELRQQLNTGFGVLMSEGASLTPEAARALALHLHTGPEPVDAPATSRRALDTLLGITSH